MNKRMTARFAIAGTTTVLLAASIVRTYQDLGTEPAANDRQRLQKVCVGAAVIAALTWLTATV